MRLSLLSNKLRGEKRTWFGSLPGAPSVAGKESTAWAALLAVSALVLAISLAGLYFALKMPASLSATTTLVRYEHRGQFFYTVQLKPNSLFDDNELEPGGMYIARLIDTIRMSYTYSFDVDQPPKQADFVYQVSADYGFPGIWQKRLILVPPTKGDRETTLSFVVPVADLVEALNTFRRETGTNPGTPELDIVVRVDPIVETEPGLITEPFEHTFAFRFEGELVIPDGKLESRRENALTRKTTRRNDRRTVQLSLSLLGVLTSISALLATGWWYDQAQKNRPWVEQELERARKQAGNLLVRVVALPQLDRTVDVCAFEDLVLLAEETLHPILCVVEDDCVVYCVVSGLNPICYRFVRQNEEFA